MAINFPTSLDTLTNPTSTDTLDSPSHSTQHANVNDIVEALEAKVGINSSAVTTSHDYKLSGVTGTDKAVSLTGTEVLTNKTLTSPTINGLNISDEQFTVSDNGDVTKALVFELSGATTAKTATVTSSHSDNRTITLPDASDTLVGKATTDTLTNKTIDANGTGNSISNIEVADFAGSAIVIESEGIASNDNDTTLPTSAAVKDYADSLATGDIKIANSGGTATLGTSTTNEVTLLQQSISANLLGTSGAVGLKIYITDFDLANTQNCAIKLKYGSTTVSTNTITSGGGGDESNSTGYIEAHLFANAATDAQTANMVTTLGGASATVATGTGSASEDSTGALNLTVTIQFSGSSVNNAFTYVGYTIYKIV